MCEVYADDFDSWAAWSNTPRKARKAHRCDSCGAAISPGEAYNAHSHVGDGTAESEKQCFGCWWVDTAFSGEHGFSMAPSYLLSRLRECLHNAPRDAEWRTELASVLRRVRVSNRGAARG